MSTILTVRQLSKSYSGVQALEDVDVDVQSGEVLGLVGPNGSGKTTLFNCVTGFTRASSGTIKWQGRDTTRLAPDQVARLGIVRTFQQKMVFPRPTVGENMEMAWQNRGNGGGGHAFASPGELLEFLGLTSMAGTPAADIPFGSARKLGLGLALAARPTLLLLDEPAAGLNQDESHDLATLVGTIKDLGITVWVIEHDMSLVMAACQRVIVLHAGRTIAEGAPAEIAKDREVITVFLGEKFARSQSA